ncbi:hypothetical protein RLIN73S_02788 [Rhodanobacter lindaniclasticus]
MSWFDTCSGQQRRVCAASWAALTDATSYQLERTHPQEGVAIIYNGPNTSSSQLTYATGLVQFRVKACNSAGCSVFSAYQRADSTVKCSSQPMRWRGCGSLRDFTAKWSCTWATRT